MTEVDHGAYETRVANMIQTVQTLAAKHGCTVQIDFDGEFFWIDGPEENQVALARALNENLSWCEDILQ